MHTQLQLEGSASQDPTGTGILRRLGGLRRSTGGSTVATSAVELSMGAANLLRE